jgi:hypothetical protein
MVQLETAVRFAIRGAFLAAVTGMAVVGVVGARSTFDSAITSAPAILGGALLFRSSCRCNRGRRGGVGQQ